MAYSVSYWGSHPDHDNDDCWTGADFETFEEALAAFQANPSTVIPRSLNHLSLDLEAAFVQIDGDDPILEERLSKLGLGLVRANPLYSKRHAKGDDWDRERAMQAGMAFGCQGYNEAMGYD